MDPLNDNVTALLNNSSSQFVQELWKDGEISDLFWPNIAYQQWIAFIFCEIIKYATTILNSHIAQRHLTYYIDK